MQIFLHQGRRFLSPDEFACVSVGAMGGGIGRLVRIRCVPQACGIGLGYEAIEYG